MRPIEPRALVVRHRANRNPWWPIGIVLLTAAVVTAPFAVNALARSNGAGDRTEQAVELSVAWWGGQERAIITEKALDLYTQRHPKVTFAKQWGGNQGYYDKLAEQAAAGTAPDIFQVDDNGLSLNAKRDFVLDLTKYVSTGRIDVSRFAKSLVDYGVVDGKNVAIASAENTPAMVYDKTVVKRLGMPEPETGWSWDKLVEWGEQLTIRSGGETWGTTDPSADYKALWLWLRQQNKEFYNGSQLGFSTADLKRWFDIWVDARKRKAAPTAAVMSAANSGDVSKQLVVTKQAATSFVWSNQLAEMQKTTQNELGMVAYPGDPKGQWARASQYWAGFKTTEHPDLVADVIDFLVNDPEAAKILGTERGLCANIDNRELISSTLTPQMQMTVAFENALTPKFGKAPPVPPPAHAKIRPLLIQAAETVQASKASSEKAAEQFVKDATALLSAE